MFRGRLFLNMVTVRSNVKALAFKSSYPLKVTRETLSFEPILSHGPNYNCISLNKQMSEKQAVLVTMTLCFKMHA